MGINYSHPLEGFFPQYTSIVIVMYAYCRAFRNDERVQESSKIRYVPK